MVDSSVSEFISSPVGFVCIALCAVFSWLGWAPRKRWSLRKIPGPFALPFLGNLPTIASKDITFFIYEVAQKYGPVAQVWLGARPWVVVSEPTAFRKLAFKFTARPADGDSFFHMLVGEPREVDRAGLVIARGPPWRAGRRAFETSVMHPATLASHVPAILRCIDRCVATLVPFAESGEALNIRTELGNLSLAIAGEVAYGVDFWSEEGESGTGTNGTGADGGHSAAAELVAACRECFGCLELESSTVYLRLQILLPALRPLWMWLAEHLPDAAQTRNMRARQRVADVSRRLMQQWQQQQQASKEQLEDGAHAAEGVLQNSKNGTSCNSDMNGSKGTAFGGISSSSFLATMLEERKREGIAGELELHRMTDIEVIAQGFTFILASFETTSTTLSLVFYLLAVHPVVQEKLRQELTANTACLGDMDRLGKLPYLDAVLRESQRIYPVASNVIMRDVTSDVELPNGAVLPRGTPVILSAYNMHMDPAQWPEPERFRPERFLPEAQGLLGPTDPNAYAPFGMGARMCVGYKLAMMMMKMILASLLLRFKLELHPKQPLPLRLKTGLTMGPADGVWLSLSNTQ